MDISPRDTSPTSVPLYQREHLNREKAPVKEVTRFVSERIIADW